jgi:5-(carboxyamino)imidazole ribonucleotide mutase
VKSFRKPFVGILMGSGNGRNAGLLAVKILATSDSKLRSQVLKFKARLATELRVKNRNLRAAQT